MASELLRSLSAAQLPPRPAIRPGYTVRVHERFAEGGKERVQVFEGLVIAVHRGATPASATFTVRRIASGVGVERVFALCSSLVRKIEVTKVAEVRRAKLNFLRGRRGKAARLSERFTTSEEFAVATAKEPDRATDEEEVVEEQEQDEKREEEEKAEQEDEK